MEYFIEGKKIMDSRTLKALKGSIRKWEKIVDGSGLDKGPDNCPLCKEFWADGCFGCPIYQKTLCTCCEDTPYGDFCDNADLIDSNTRVCNDDSLHYAIEMLEFLRSLLPTESND